jgi:type III restriction enzyme
MTDLPLAAALTAKTNQLCIGLEDGAADIYDLVTLTTAELLRWWFLADICATRPFNFHTGQRLAILNSIVAHEVLAAPNLQAFYQQVVPDALLEGGRLSEVAQTKHGHPKYCLKMATGTGKTWVMQALMIWSLLNKTAALAERIDDARFTRHFLVVAPGLIVYDRLLDALRGKLQGVTSGIWQARIHNSHCCNHSLPMSRQPDAPSYQRRLLTTISAQSRASFHWQPTL